MPHLWHKKNKTLLLWILYIKRIFFLCIKLNVIIPLKNTNLCLIIFIWIPRKKKREKREKKASKRLNRASTLCLRRANRVFQRAEDLYLRERKKKSQQNATSHFTRQPTDFHQPQRNISFWKRKDDTTTQEWSLELVTAWKGRNRTAEKSIYIYIQSRSSPY